MKKINTFLFIIAMVFSILSCSNNKGTKGEDKKSTDTNANSQNTEQIQSEITTETVPVKIQTPNPVSQQPQATTQTAQGMNPPHGQPGHDCKIPVGSPLNSSIKSNVVNPQSPVIQKPQMTTQTAQGMNPPHGQPGHDCKIPVGAPLNK